MEGGAKVQGIKRINNNVAICLDNAGRQVVAMGSGIGFGKFPKDIPLSAIERTFYQVDVRLMDGIANTPREILELSTQIVDEAMNTLPYGLSPNLPFTLADHIDFAIKRVKQNISIRMPISYEIAQSFPVEYRIGLHATHEIWKRLRVRLDDKEAAGIAICIVNSRIELDDQVPTSASSHVDEDMLEDVTEIVEDVFARTIDRRTFAYSRFATHTLYLLQRVRNTDRRTEPIDATAAAQLPSYQKVKEQFPKGGEAVDRIASHLQDEWRVDLDDTERLFLLMHIGRII